MNTQIKSSLGIFLLLLVLTGCKLKQQDNRVALEQNWQLQTISKRSINFSGDTPPHLNLSITKKAYSGYNGCNTYNGDIKETTASKISFGSAMATRRLCEDMETPDGFMDGLSKTVSYNVKNNTLTFFDGEGNVLLSFSLVEK